MSKQLNPNLSQEQKAALFEGKNEYAFDSKWLHNDKHGTYTCANCGTALFSSSNKYESGSGWPSFDDSLPGAIGFREDTSHNMTRTEMLCATCGAHLGHIFPDGPPNTTGMRYCASSLCLDFEPDTQTNTQ